MSRIPAVSPLGLSCKYGIRAQVNAIMPAQIFPEAAQLALDAFQGRRRTLSPQLIRAGRHCVPPSQTPGPPRTGSASAHGASGRRRPAGRAILCRPAAHGTWTPGRRVRRPAAPGSTGPNGRVGDDAGPPWPRRDLGSALRRAPVRRQRPSPCPRPAGRWPGPTSPLAADNIHYVKSQPNSPPGSSKEPTAATPPSTTGCPATRVVRGHHEGCAVRDPDDYEARPSGSQVLENDEVPVEVSTPTTVGTPSTVNGTPLVPPSIV